MTEREVEFLGTQGQEYFSDWTQAEQERFKHHQSSLWSLIPEQHRGKAQRFAQGH